MHLLINGISGNNAIVNQTIDKTYNQIRQKTVDHTQLYHQRRVNNLVPIFHPQTFILPLTDDPTQYHRLSPNEHDTIGMIALDSKGDMAAGTSTNGLNFKIPGRVGDSALVGSGAYVDNEAGGACATGNGDIMLRFVPSYHVVQLMRQGSAPDFACADAVRRIAMYYPNFTGAVLALAKDGRHGAACYGFNYFPYAIMQQGWIEPKVIEIPCLKLSRGQKEVPFSFVSFSLSFLVLYIHFYIIV
jgi:isoaspartyl peptidase/L-asparaginase-like protein (Ntn-hydrolase superfamily)